MVAIILLTGRQLRDFWGSFGSGTRLLALFWHFLWSGDSLLLLLRLLLLLCLLLLLHLALLFFLFLSTLFDFLLTCRIFASATNFFFIYPLSIEHPKIWWSKHVYTAIKSSMIIYGEQCN